ncbi:MAG: NADH-quinone oxidoreductase subunit N [Candidatus Methanomethylophilus sp.]|nr:NADH-quinone oxidoreductase subunit N [Methanomethylophilus sp.]MDD3233087.1 NADH-quinone oxidoreductase subunit N [Methanomethylophilus sp.]MDD4221931.1 NADH-quinone oxidoreductase subunit N [Methanomethylophilus sp.]
MDASIVTGIFGAYTPIAPMIIMIIGALIMPALYFGFKKKAPVTAVQMIIILISLALNMILLGTGYEATYANLFTYDAFSGLLILLFQIVVGIVAFVSYSSIETTTLHFGAYSSLLLIAAAGMMFVGAADDLISIFVGVETVSISSYALVAMKRNDPRAAEAAVKYVIIGGLSTALTIYGISMLYGVTGTVELSELGVALAASGYSWAFIIALITMMAGYGFKVAMVPFHMWAPDVYEGASTPVSIMLATGSKKMGLAVFFKIFLVMLVTANVVGGLGIVEVQYLFAIVAALSMTIGNVVAISQTNIKRMLAYSSIAQAGYILIAMAVMSQYALSAGLFHMFTHVFMKGGAFLVVGALICAGLGEKITDYNGLAKRAPLVAFAMLLFLFSLAGVPPLAGFTSKFFLFSSAIYSEDGVMTQWIWLAFVAILNSAISLYYYVRIIKAMYIEKPAAGADSKLKIPKTFAIAIAVCVVFVIVLGLYPGIIMDYCAQGAAALFGLI